MSLRDFWKIHHAQFEKHLDEEYHSFAKDCMLETGTAPTFKSFKRHFEKEILEEYKNYNGFTKAKVSHQRYLITFTRNPNTQLSKEDFKQAVVKQLQRKIIYNGEYSFEHEDTNIHCHAYVIATHALSKSNFNSHIRKFGNIDVTRVTHDHGVKDYISKESLPRAINPSLPPHPEGGSVG